MEESSFNYTETVVVVFPTIRNHEGKFLTLDYDELQTKSLRYSKAVTSINELTENEKRSLLIQYDQMRKQIESLRHYMHDNLN